MLLINRVMRRRKEGGAALVEFAVMAPFLVLLLLGIIEFGYKFGQYNEIRHAVRETARYAAVSNPNRIGTATIDKEDIKDAACDALQLPTGTFVITTTVSDFNGDGTLGNIGDVATVKITATLPALSGFPLITPFIPNTLANQAEFRLEQKGISAAPGPVITWGSNLMIDEALPC